MWRQATPRHPWPPNYESPTDSASGEEAHGSFKIESMSKPTMGTNNVIPRACQNCRIRKIRCSRQIPCSNCVTSNIACQATGSVSVARPPPPPPATQTQTHSLESKHFEALSSRLASLEKLVQSVVAEQPSRKVHQWRHGLDGHSPESLTKSDPAADVSVQFHGESSFVGQADLASRIAQLPVPGPHGDSPIGEELKSLRAVIHGGAAAATSDEFGARDFQLQVEPVPADFVIRILQVLRERKSLVFLIQPVREPEYLERLSQRIYFPVNAVSTGEYTVFFGLLAFASRELLELDHHAMPEDELRHYHDICQRNFQSGIRSHELIAVPTLENTLALVIAAREAQMDGNQSVQWNLSSAAARHCITLGYHRITTLKQLSPEEAELRRCVLWQTYITNVGLALPLGRAAIIQDYDIDIGLPSISTDPRRAVWHTTAESFIQFSTIQAQVYRRLYSPAALKLASFERQRIVEEVLVTLEHWYCEWTKIDHSAAYHSEVFTIFFSPVTVAYYSLITLVHRAVTTSGVADDLSPACFAAAKKGLQKHLEVYPERQKSGHWAVYYYAIWILIYCSFTPYIITFLHCIAYSDAEDVRLLGLVLETLDEIASVCKPCVRQVEVCRALHRTAKAFIESRGTFVANSVAPYEDRTINLPLNNAAMEHYDWDMFESSLEEWGTDGINPNLFNLGSRLDANPM